MNTLTLLEEYAETINTELERLIPRTDNLYSQLYDAARYSLLSGGKRLRPALTLAATKTLEGNVNAAIVPACAMEMVHTYSMIHDDLPSMDDDDYRRGKPTLHKIYPEGHAILTGSYLLTYAFELLATNPLLNPHQKTELVACLAQYAGSNGMIGGQVMDLYAVGKTPNLETLQQMYLNKTAALITASLEFGAIIAQASTTSRQLLRQFGQNIGYAFQIIDDIIDVTASEQKHGTTTASDEKNDKTTFVTLLGIDQSQTTAKQLLETALKQLQQLPGNHSQLSLLAHALINRDI